jgi:hypothetical protein
MSARLKVSGARVGRRCMSVGRGRAPAIELGGVAEPLPFHPEAPSPRVQVPLEIINQTPAPRYPAILIALAMNVNNAPPSVERMSSIGPDTLIGAQACQHAGQYDGTVALGPVGTPARPGGDAADVELPPGVHPRPRSVIAETPREPRQRYSPGGE